MNLYFDLDVGYFVSAPGTYDRVSTLTFKRGDTTSLVVRFVRGLVVQELGDDTETGVFGMKEDGDYDGDFVASAGTWTKAGSTTTTTYTFALNLATSELNTLLGVGAAADVGSVNLMAEMEWIVAGVTTSSPTITATVSNDVVRGTESGPAEITAGTPVNYTAAVAGTLTSDGSTPLTFPVMTYTEDLTSRPSFDNTPNTLYFTALSVWLLTDGTSVFTSTATVATPDLIPAGAWDGTTNPTGWKPTAPATGTPVVTLTPATAGVAGSQYVSATHLYVVASVTDGVPLWRKIAHEAL